MTLKMKVTCNLGHEHEIDVPNDLISVADGARLVDRSMQALMSRINNGELIGYPASQFGTLKVRNTRGLVRTLISKNQLLDLYPQHAQAS